MNNSRGVITLEATIVIPLFLTLIIGLLIIIRLAFVQVALQNAADETVKQLAASLYPLESSMQRTVSSKDEWFNSLLSWLPPMIRPTVEQLLNNKLDNSITQPVMRALMKPVLWHYMDQSSKSTLISYDQMYIDHVAIPFLNNNEEMFGIEVRYEFKLTLPYYQRTIVIRKRAYERVWFGA